MEDNILETMPIGPLFVRMAVPAVLSQMINILYNLVDKMFIGHMPEVVIRIFTSTAALQAYAVRPLRTYLCLLCIYGVQVACQYSLVALDQAKTAIFLTIWRKVILLIPMIFILPLFVPDPTLGVFLAEPIADCIAVCTTGTLFYRYYKMLNEM